MICLLCILLLLPTFASALHPVCPVCATLDRGVSSWCRGCTMPLSELRKNHAQWLRQDPPRQWKSEEKSHLPGPGSDTLAVELIEKGFAAFAEGKWQAAENFARSALHRAPKLAESRRLLARLCRKRGQEKEALHYYARLLELLPLDREAEGALQGKP